MGFQFVHMESYSRKADGHGRSTDFIFSEALRCPGASVHVSTPSPPVLVHGVGLDKVQEMHDSAVASATVTVKGGKTRKLRSDQKTLHTVVASHPNTMDEVRTDPVKRREAEQWESRTIEWLQSQYGDDLKSIIRHEDESHYHLHAYVVPLSDPELKAAKFHPGVSAKRETMATGPADGEDQKALGKRADVAYKAAMRAWQDSYHEAVAVPCGLTRLGPQRRRLSRDEWQREKAQAKSLQNVVQRAKAVKADGEAYIGRAKAYAAKVAADAARQQEAARKAAAAALTAQGRARQEQTQAQAAMAAAVRYGGWAGRLRALWDGFRKSNLAEKIRRELNGEIDRWRETAKDSESKRLEAERKLYEAERQARAAKDDAFKAIIERDRLNSILKPAAGHSAPERSPPPTLELRPNRKKEGLDT